MSSTLSMVALSVYTISHRSASTALDNPAWIPSSSLFRFLRKAASLTLSLAKAKKMTGLGIGLGVKKVLGPRVLPAVTHGVSLRDDVFLQAHGSLTRKLVSLCACVLAGSLVCGSLGLR